MLFLFLAIDDCFFAFFARFQRYCQSRSFRNVHGLVNDLVDVSTAEVGRLGVVPVPAVIEQDTVVLDIARTGETRQIWSQPTEDMTSWTGRTGLILSQRTVLTFILIGVQH